MNSLNPNLNNETEFFKNLKINVDTKNNKSTFVYSNHTYSVYLNSNQKLNLNADDWQEVAKKVGLMLFKKGLFNSAFDQVRIEEKGIQTNKTKLLAHDADPNTRQEFEDVKDIVFKRVKPLPSPKQVKEELQKKQQVEQPCGVNKTKESKLSKPRKVRSWAKKTLKQKAKKIISQPQQAVKQEEKKQVLARPQEEVVSQPQKPVEQQEKKQVLIQPQEEVVSQPQKPVKQENIEKNPSIEQEKDDIVLTKDENQSEEVQLIDEKQPSAAQELFLSLTIRPMKYLSNYMVDMFKGFFNWDVQKKDEASQSNFLPPINPNISDESAKQVKKIEDVAQLNLFNSNSLSTSTPPVQPESPDPIESSFNSHAYIPKPIQQSLSSRQITFIESATPSTSKSVQIAQQKQDAVESQAINSQSLSDLIKMLHQLGAYTTMTKNGIRLHLNEELNRENLGLLPNPVKFIIDNVDFIDFSNSGIHVIYKDTTLFPAIEANNKVELSTQKKEDFDLSNSLNLTEILTLHTIQKTNENQLIHVDLKNIDSLEIQNSAVQSVLNASFQTVEPLPSAAVNALVQVLKDSDQVIVCPNKFILFLGRDKITSFQQKEGVFELFEDNTAQAALLIKQMQQFFNKQKQAGNFQIGSTTSNLKAILSTPDSQKGGISPNVQMDQVVDPNPLQELLEVDFSRLVSFKPNTLKPTDAQTIAKKPLNKRQVAPIPSVLSLEEPSSSKSLEPVPVVKPEITQKAQHTQQVAQKTVFNAYTLPKLMKTLSESGVPVAKTKNGIRFDLSQTVNLPIQLKTLLQDVKTIEVSPNGITIQSEPTIPSLDAQEESTLALTTKQNVEMSEPLGLADLLALQNIQNPNENQLIHVDLKNINSLEIQNSAVQSVLNASFQTVEPLPSAAVNALVQVLKDSDQVIVCPNKFILFSGRDKITSFQQKEGVFELFEDNTAQAALLIKQMQQFFNKQKQAGNFQIGSTTSNLKAILSTPDSQKGGVLPNVQMNQVIDPNPLQELLEANFSRVVSFKPNTLKPTDAQAIAKKSLNKKQIAPIPSVLSLGKSNSSQSLEATPTANQEITQKTQRTQQVAKKTVFDSYPLPNLMKTLSESGVPVAKAKNGIRFDLSQTVNLPVQLKTLLQDVKTIEVSPNGITIQSEPTIPSLDAKEESTLALTTKQNVEMSEPLGLADLLALQNIQNPNGNQLVHVDLKNLKALEIQNSTVQSVLNANFQTVEPLPLEAINALVQVLKDSDQVIVCPNKFILFLREDKITSLQQEEGIFKLSEDNTSQAAFIVKELKRQLQNKRNSLNIALEKPTRKAIRGSSEANISENLETPKADFFKLSDVLGVNLKVSNVIYVNPAAFETNWPALTNTNLKSLGKVNIVPPAIKRPTTPGFNQEMSIPRPLSNPDRQNYKMFEALFKTALVFNVARYILFYKTLTETLNATPKDSEPTYIDQNADVIVSDTPEETSQALKNAKRINARFFPHVLPIGSDQFKDIIDNIDPTLKKETPQNSPTHADHSNLLFTPFGSPEVDKDILSMGGLVHVALNSVPLYNKLLKNKESQEESTIFLDPVEKRSNEEKIKKRQEKELQAKVESAFKQAKLFQPKVDEKQEESTILLDPVEKHSYENKSNVQPLQTKQFRYFKNGLPKGYFKNQKTPVFNSEFFKQQAATTKQPIHTPIQQPTPQKQVDTSGIAPLAIGTLNFVKKYIK
jgi:hypothetical protein